MSSKSELHHINFYNLSDRSIPLDVSPVSSEPCTRSPPSHIGFGRCLPLYGRAWYSYFILHLVCNFFSFPLHFAQCVWFSLFSPICCPLDYKMKMHNGNIEFRLTLSVCFSHSFNISCTLSLSVKYGCWQSLCCSEDTHRDRSWFLSQAMLWKQVSVCVCEKNKPECAQTDRCLCCNVVLLKR